MDKDFIVNMNFFGFGTSKVMAIGLNWLIRQINICLKRRKTELFDKKPGAIALESTKIIWIKMIKHPYGCLQEFDKIFAPCNRFNNMLDEVRCNTNPQHYVLSIRVEETDFHLNGELSEQGQITFWKEVDQCMKKFDRGEINLKPKGSKDFDPKRHSNEIHTREISHHHLSTPRKSKLPTPLPQYIAPKQYPKNYR